MNVNDFVYQRPIFALENSLRGPGITLASMANLQTAA